MHNIVIMRFLLFFPFVTFVTFVMEKDGKTCFNAETNDFDQRMACEAPICWLKYTTYGPHLLSALLNPFPLPPPFKLKNSKLHFYLFDLPPWRHPISVKIQSGLIFFIGELGCWYHRTKPEDQINRKPDVQKMTKQPKKQKTIWPNSTVLNLAFGCQPALRSLKHRFFCIFFLLFRKRSKTVIQQCCHLKVLWRIKVKTHLQKKKID